MEYTYVKVEVLLPEDNIIKMRDSLNKMGVLTIGNYDNVISYSHVKGFWRPLTGAAPFDGSVNQISFGAECKMEFRCSYEDIKEVKNTIRQVHPYEEPVINVLPLID
ncbi:cytochrome C biogenesis protein [Alkalibacillus salilacus]|uniref:Cytochrome C biogenesis protein n=1 Tax=Alkalibacillus salilacus TaxID=284582 RepID=A0ABT9VF67_9BACI|nr:cytochrome C biogenesis protein [Alkalibacillus salilacus]MDQ0159599.1 hypothetical protein [Alkalibacillus salilacus]